MSKQQAAVAATLSVEAGDARVMASGKPASSGDRRSGHAGVLVAVPCFNTQRTIASVVLVAQRFASEVLVVDDGSIDDTAWVAEQAGATVIRHTRNRGYGAALRTCFEYARAKGSDVLVILDGDGQHRPDAIPRVAAPVVNGSVDVCIGSRFLEPRATAKVPAYRKFGIGVLTWLTNRGMKKGDQVRDAQSGFRAYSRAAVAQLDPKEPAMGASAEIVWDADRRGLRIAEVPIEVDYDLEGSTQSPLSHGLSVIGSMIRYAESEHALLFFSMPGFVMFLTGTVMSIVVVQQFQAGLPLDIVWAFASVLLIALGLMMGFTGLILHAVINAARRLR